MPDIEGSDVLLDSAQDKIVLIDEAGVFQYANQAVKRTLGYEPTDLIGTNAFEYIHPDDREQVRRNFKEVITATEFTDATAEYRLRGKDGAWHWMESRFSNLTDEELDGYVVSSRDITDRVEAEQREEETATRLKEISEKATDVLWMFSADWRELLFMNPAYEDVYGANLEEAREDPSVFLDFIHPDDIPLVKDAMNRLSRGESVDIEYRVDPADDFGTYVWVQGEPIIEDDEVVRIVGFTRDITDRRRRERQLAVMDNLLRHNLRNDMNVILAAADIIENEPKADIEEQTCIIRRVGHDLIKSAEKQRDIIGILTDSERPETIDLVGKVHNAITRVRRRYPEAVIETDLPSSLRVRALEEIELAVSELVENALKHAESDPEVMISGGRDSDGAWLTVTDTGPLIADEEIRVLTGEREMDALYHSSGLGLWLIYWVVDLSNGTIDFDKEGAAGNTVTVRFQEGDEPESVTGRNVTDEAEIHESSASGSGTSGSSTGGSDSSV